MDRKPPASWDELFERIKPIVERTWGPPRPTDFELWAAHEFPAHTTPEIREKVRRYDEWRREQTAVLRSLPERSDGSTVKFDLRAGSTPENQSSTKGDHIMTTRTITLTDRPPVKINDEQWPTIASASVKDYDGEIESQATRTSKLFIKVRQHADGRALVYGGYDYDSRWRGARNEALRGGELLQDATSEDIVSAIRRLAEDLDGRIGEDHFGLTAAAVAADCIADLPAEEI